MNEKILKVKEAIRKTEKVSVKKLNELTVALVGSPNSGKTTIFNNITGLRQHVGNYPGVTVEHKIGEREYKDFKFRVIDLPGIYNLTAYSEEEVITRNFIINEKPDVVINVVDASSLERNLYLTTQLIELGVNLIIVFNMSDLLERKGVEINEGLLSQLLGAPIVKTVGNKNIGTVKLLEKTIEAFTDTQIKKKVNINYGEEIENEIARITNLLKKKEKVLLKYDIRWISLKFLEKDTIILKELKTFLGKTFYEKAVKLLSKSVNHIKSIVRDEPETIIAEARYGFINGALKESMLVKKGSEFSLSDKIDRVLLNRFFGLPIFALIMWLVFQIVFKIGDYPTRWLGIGFNRLTELLINIMPEGLLKSLFIDGIISGVGGVFVFTPKIILLFSCIALIEDSGYMARAAFIMDRIMHKIGLHGKSFVPMLIGFGCTIPAYMCGRTLENRNDRMITMHINTFMSCGGRLPIYILFAGTFFAKNAGNVIFSIYLIGILIAVLFARVLRATRYKGESEPFVMELPVYRAPTVKGIFIHTWERTWQYLKKAGTVILAISIIVWILFTFPRIGEASTRDYNSQIQSVEQSYADGVISEELHKSKISEIKAEMASEKLEFSAAGRIGHFIEPVFKPLGFDWRLAIASISGIAGKEVVVSTLGTVFSLSGTEKESEELRAAMRNQYNPLTGFNFMLFSLLYFPCIASLAVFQREAGTKEMFFQAGFTLGFAWTVSLIVFQIGRLFI
ncbi:MAG: ferrous iron transport protein B [Actinobacteria bacterium]|nr:ferrous iron transport protein B [Actinomycetota bacterium]